jgi:hypothetical protein
MSASGDQSSRPSTPAGTSVDGTGTCYLSGTLCVGRSVEFLDSGQLCRAWDSPWSLRKVTFEPGSKLLRISDDAFSGLPYLKYLDIPASLAVLPGSAFIGSKMRTIEIDPKNPYFTFKDNFLIKRRPSISIVRYCGKDKRVVIPNSIEILGRSCFEANDSIEKVKFPFDCEVRVIRRRAFSRCSALRSIYIPSSVQSLHRLCFRGCGCLFDVTFASNSKLATLPSEAFESCRMPSLIIPSSVEVLGWGCFRSCTALERVTFESGSQLKRVEDCVFTDCRALASLSIGSLVEFVGNLCFEGCGCLKNFTFSSPAQLVEVRSLPPDLTGAIDVPDSVEGLHWLKRPCNGRKAPVRTTLTFGRESRLAAITIAGKTPKSSKRRCARVFVCLSARTLKRLRSSLEFSGGDGDPTGHSKFDEMSLPDQESDFSDE